MCTRVSSCLGEEMFEDLSTMEFLVHITYIQRYMAMSQILRQICRQRNEWVLVASAIPTVYTRHVLQIQDTLVELRDVKGWKTMLHVLFMFL